MLIDFHTHCFPDKLAARAINQLSYAAGGLIPCTDGTVTGLRGQMEQQKVDKAVVLNIATNPHQQHAVNDFAAAVNSEQLLAFGSVHPEAPDALAELERIKALGLRGVKFHPEYQNFFVDEQRLKPIYRKISQLGLITVFHAGCDYGFAPPYHCLPQNLSRALQWLDGPVVAAHWGGAACSAEVLRYLCGLPLYFDISFGYGQIARPAAMEILARHGAERLLFGSDSPWHEQCWEQRHLATLELSAAEREQICWRNAARLLQVDV